MAQQGTVRTSKSEIQQKIKNIKFFKGKKWRKYSIEFLSVFIAVVSAFALNNWNDNRRAGEAEAKILAEIENGLSADIEDIRLNKKGHKDGISSTIFWRDITLNNKVSTDSIIQHYFNLTRDYISIQNVSGYETLKSRGLELIENDSLRYAIISLYEYDYNTLRKFEEEYAEMQFHQNYFEALNNVIAPNFTFDKKGNITGIELPLRLDEAEKKIVLSLLWKIIVNRNFILYYYGEVETKIQNLMDRIENELEN